MDWLPVLLVPIVLVIDAALSAQGKPIGVVNVLCAFVASVPLALRRHITFPLEAPLIVGGVVLALWQLHPANTVVIIPMIAMFELALNGDRRRSLWMSLAVVPCVVGTPVITQFSGRKGSRIMPAGRCPELTDSVKFSSDPNQDTKSLMCGAPRGTGENAGGVTHSLSGAVHR